MEMVVTDRGKGKAEVGSKRAWHSATSLTWLGLGEVISLAPDTSQPTLETISVIAARDTAHELSSIISVLLSNTYSVANTLYSSIFAAIHLKPRPLSGGFAVKVEQTTIRPAGEHTYP